METLNHHLAKDGFRLRGLHMSRIDGFSDVVFGFALTLIVVSLEVPKNFSELHHLLRGFIPFGLTFLMLMLIWHTHYKFFRRYGLHDIGTMWLNGLLLFFVLFYVYPLKFMMSALFNNGVGLESYEQVREMTLLYGIGFAAIYGLFAAMYANALRRKAALELSPLELELSRIYFWEEACNGIIGALVCGLALVLPAPRSPMATFLFLLITAHRTWLGRRSAQICRKYHAENCGPALDM